MAEGILKRFEERNPKRHHMARPARNKTLEDVKRIQNDNDIRFEEHSAGKKEVSRTIEEQHRILDKMLETSIEDRKKNVAVKESIVEVTESIVKMREAEAETRKAEAERSKALDKKLDKVSKSLGVIESRRGKFIETLALPAIKRIVKDELRAEFRGKLGAKQNLKARGFEFDAFAVRGEDPEEIFVFEIKRTFSEKTVKQIIRSIGTFREHYPEHAETPVYPFLVAAAVNPKYEHKIWDAGITLITFSDEMLICSKPPKGFSPRYDYGMEKARGRSVPPRYYLEQTRRAAPRIDAH